ncbi:MAG: hypothetical protein K9J13_12445 [Saprospiraceae bacterium]|nr:hypothetical protein [Saprospiraceae bacterium]
MSNLPKIKTIYLILFLFLLMSCSNKNAENKISENIAKSQPDSVNTSINDVHFSNAEKKYKEFVPIAKYAQWETPYVEIGYDEHTYLNPSLTISFHYGENNVFQLFETGMFQFEEINLDTIRLGNGLYPALIVDWHTEMYHYYGIQYPSGLDAGEWARSLSGYSIWDMNRQKEIFSANYLNTSYATGGEVDTSYFRECFWEYNVKLDSANKIIILDSLDQKYIGECLNTIDMKMGNYYFEGDTFVRK